MSEAPLLSVGNLHVRFPVPGRGHRYVHAVDDVSFEINAREAFGLIGESGCGKTTLGRTVVRLQRPTSGRILVHGHDIAGLRKGRELRLARRDLQMVFQDPAGSLDPRLTVLRSITEPALAAGGAQRRDARQRAERLLSRVGLDPGVAERYPYQLSGGQLQRISIARALICEPALVVLDEPVSALDVSVQAQIINLLAELQAEFGLAYLFVAHDLAVVRHLCSRIAIMYLGRIVEIGTREQVFASPAHPYTAALLSAVPVTDPALRQPDRVILRGDPPSPVSLPTGCRFRSRCPRADARCATDDPVLAEAPGGGLVACHHPQPSTPELAGTTASQSSRNREPSPPGAPAP